MLDLIFVYGTLRSEFDNPHARFLRDAAAFMGQASVRGSIYLIADYPGFRALPAGEVVGELYRLRSAENALARLDSYEGGEYARVTAEVLCHGQTLKAWIYCFLEQPAQETRIASGDFRTP